MRLLILDDDLFFGRCLDRQLQQPNISAQVVTTIFAAMRCLETEPFDGVLFDHRLGEGPTGLQLLRFVAARFPALSRILMSGEIVDGWQGPAEALLQKPFSPQELIDLLRSRDALRRAR